VISVSKASCGSDSTCDASCWRGVVGPPRISRDSSIQSIKALLLKPQEDNKAACCLVQGSHLQQHMHVLRWRQRL
jgi:hypothetical protein